MVIVSCACSLVPSRLTEYALGWLPTSCSRDKNRPTSVEMTDYLVTIVTVKMDPDFYPGAANNDDTLLYVACLDELANPYIYHAYWSMEQSPLSLFFPCDALICDLKVFILPHLNFSLSGLGPRSVATTMDILSLLDVKLSARYTWMPNVDSLEFVNCPIESGPYQNQDPRQIRQPNVGLYALSLAHKNQVYLEYENHLCNILDMLESLEATGGKEIMEDRVVQELIRINRLKGLEWSSQCYKGGVSGAVVNTGVFMPCSVFNCCF